MNCLRDKSRRPGGVGESLRDQSRSSRGAPALLLCVALLLLFLPGLLHSQESEEDLDRFFEEVFGVSPEPVDQPVRLLVDRTDYGLVTALVTPAGTLTAFRTESLLEQLEELLNEAGVAAVQRAAAEDGIASVGALAEVGMAVDYDRTAFVVTVTIPGEYRRTQRLSIRPDPTPGSIPEGIATVEPAELSGGSAVGGSVSRRENSDLGATRWAGTVEMKPFVSAFDWLLRGDFDLLLEEEGEDLSASNIYLRRFWPDSALQLTAGDVIPGTDMFQSGRRIQGVELRREVESDGVIGDPLAEFTLDDAAEVELAVNDNVIYERRLGPGSYEVVDVPMGTGISEVEIRFPGLAEEPIRLSRPYESTLLPEGEQEFSHAVGTKPILWDDETELSDFTSDYLRLSSLHRYGFATNFTGTAGLQLSPEVGQLSVGGDTATLLGNFGLATGLSLSEEVGAGFGARSSYELFLPSLTVRPSFRLSVGWVGESLADPDRPFGFDERPLQFSAAYGQRIAGRFTGSLRGAYRVDPDDGSGDYQLSMNLTSPRINEVRLGLRLEYASEVEEPSAWGGFRGVFSLRFAPRRGPRVTTSQELAEPRSTIAVEQSGSTEGSGQYALSAEGSQSFEREMPFERLGLSGRISGRRGIAATGGTWIFAPDGELSATSATLSGETGILFAGDTFAWSRVRPEQSFAILSIPQDGELSEVTVEGGASSVVVRPGFLGAATVQSRDPYEPIYVSLSPGSLPLGYELSDTRVAAVTGLGTGTVISPELKGVVFVRGVLTEPATGEPITLLPGRVYPTGESERAQLVFSNREGRFEAGGLTAGSYVFESSDGRRGTFTIPPGSAGLYELGTLEVE